MIATYTAPALVSPKPEIEGSRLSRAFSKLASTRTQIRDIYRGEPWTTKPKTN